MRRCFLSVAKMVKCCRMSSTTAGRSMLSTTAWTCCNWPSSWLSSSRHGPHISIGMRIGTVAEQAPLSGEREDIWHEHSRHFLLVDLVDLEGAIEPGHRAARGRLGLT